MKRVYDLFYPIYLDEEVRALVDGTGVVQTSERRLVDMSRYYGTRRRRSTFYLSGSLADYLRLEQAFRDNDILFYLIEEFVS